jgi:cytosine/adenosine deaminase-related metal-dependent hydrolase
VLGYGARAAGKPKSGLRTCIAELATRLDGQGVIEIDARGNLVTESFVNPHLHLCEVFTLPMVEEDALKSYQREVMGKAMAGIELASKIKEKYDESGIVDNARRAVARAALHGNLHIRDFADVDRKARLEGIKALICIRAEFRAEYRQRRPTPSQVNLSCRKPVGGTPLPRRLKKRPPANCCVQL